jgi:hypothetical protein
MGKIKYMWIALVVTSCVMFSEEVLPWDNETTHKDLSRIAAEQSVLSKANGDYLKKLGFTKALLETFVWNGTRNYVTDWLQEGAEYEDIPTLRSFNHFHNPLKQWNQAGLDENLVIPLKGKSSLLWSQDGSYQQSSVGEDWSWQKARDYYYRALTSTTDSERQVNFAKTFRGLGHQIHLIQDKTVPDHVRNDAHPEDSLLGKDRINGAMFFETWAKNNPVIVNRHALRAGHFIPHVLLTVSYENLVPITQLYDTNQYTIENPSQFFTDNKATSLAIGLAEYTNANFFSGDTIFAAERYPKDHRHYFPYPRKASTDLQAYIDEIKPLLTQIAEDGMQDKGIYIKKLRDGEIIDNFLRASRWTSKLYKMFGQGELFFKTFYRDEKCHEEYASKLIPRAVGYSAGLLNYFFRGDIDMVPDNSSAGFMVENNSDEDMSGTFELWYDDTFDKRKKAWDSHLSIGKKSKSSNITFTPPDTMKEDGKYMLVFRGELGKEKGAVIGKEITLEAIETFFLVTYGAQLVFKFEIDGGEYKIEPIEKEVYLEGDQDGWYRTWTVVTHPDTKKHFVTWPQSYQYLDYIENYALETGTNYLWRPDDFEEGSEYILTTTGGLNETDYTVSAFGRHNYTLDDKDKMVSYDESIWAKATDNGCSHLDYVYRYKNEQSGENFINGGVIASNQIGENSTVYVPGQGYTHCSGPTINNTMIAALGDNKAVFIEHKSWPQESNSTVSEKEQEFSFSADYVWCNKIWPDYKWHYLYGTKSGTFWLNSTKMRSERKQRVALNVAGEELEAVEIFPMITEVEGFDGGGGWEVSSIDGSIGEVTSPDCPGASCTVSPAAVTFTGVIERVRSEGAVIRVQDFDNLPDDNSFVMIYSLSRSVSSAGVTTPEMECSVSCSKIMNNQPSPSISLLRDCHTIGAHYEDPASSKMQRYYVAFKTPSETEIKKEILYEETVTGEVVYNKVLTGFSTQMNKETMVYTYVMKEWNGTEYDFDKRIVGIINVSDSRLPEGYRQEFIIDEEHYLIGDFDYTQIAGIGIHKF